MRLLLMLLTLALATSGVYAKKNKKSKTSISSSYQSSSSGSKSDDDDSSSDDDEKKKKSNSASNANINAQQNANGNSAVANSKDDDDKSDDKSDDDKSSDDDDDDDDDTGDTGDASGVDSVAMNAVLNIKHSNTSKADTFVDKRTFVMRSNKGMCYQVAVNCQLNCPKSVGGKCKLFIPLNTDAEIANNVKALNKRACVYVSDPVSCSAKNLQGGIYSGVNQPR